MAVPLGEPRMEGGLTVPVTIPTTSGPVTSTPLSHPQVTASKNVALVSMPPAEEEEQVSPQPELGKQVSQQTLIGSGKRHCKVLHYLK